MKKVGFWMMVISVIMLIASAVLAGFRDTLIVKGFDPLVVSIIGITIFIVGIIVGLAIFMTWKMEEEYY